MVFAWGQSHIKRTGFSLEILKKKTQDVPVDLKAKAKLSKAKNLLRGCGLEFSTPKSTNSKTIHYLLPIFFSSVP